MSGVSRRSRRSLHSSRSLMASSDSDNDNRAEEAGVRGDVQVAESRGQEQPVQSDAGSRIVQRQDTHDIPSRDWLRIVENNCVILFEESRFKPEHRIIMELIKHHPYKKWFTRHKSVPIQYIQQWWRNLRIQGNDFVSEFGGMEVRLTVGDLREILDLPEEDDLEGRNEFEDVITSEDLIAEIIRLGYNDVLRTVSEFRRNKLPPIWACLFHVVNRCLSGKHSSPDQGSKQILQIFHGLIRNKHYDYMGILWEDMKNTVEKNLKALQGRTKEKPINYIPYIRYWQLVIWKEMQKNPQIPQRKEEVHGPIFYLGKMTSVPPLVNYPNHKLLPRSLRNYIPRDSLILSEYRASMGLENPQLPTHEDQPEIRGEGSEKSSDGEDVHRDEPSESIERKNSESSVSGKEKQIESERIERLSPEVQTERDASVLATDIQVATKSAGSHLLVTNIEEDTMDLVVQLADPPSHSAAFQHAAVSQKSGEPSQLQLEGGDKSHPILLHTESGSHSPIHIEPPTLFDTSTLPGLRDRGKTPRDDPIAGHRGLGGSPGEVNITKASYEDAFVVSGSFVQPTGLKFSERMTTEAYVASGSKLDTSEFAKTQIPEKEMGDSVEKLEERVKELIEEVNEHKGQMSLKMQRMETKVDNLDVRLKDMHTSLESHKLEVKGMLSEFQKEMISQMQLVQNSILQKLSSSSIQTSAPELLPTTSTAEPEPELPQGVKRKFDDLETHDHQKGEKRQKIDVDEGTISIEDYEIADMQLSQRDDAQILEVEDTDTEEIVMEESTEVYHGKTEEIIDTEMGDDEEVSSSGEVYAEEVTMSEENTCRDLIVYKHRRVISSEFVERLMQEVMWSVICSYHIQREVRQIRPIDLMGNRESNVSYSQNFQRQLVSHFFEELEEEEFNQLEEYLMPSQFVYRSPIEIPQIDLPLKQEPLCDFILQMSDVPLARHNLGDVYPEETYKDLYHVEGEYEIIESHVDGSLDGRTQLIYTEASNRLRIPDSSLMVHKRIERVLSFQSDVFDGLNYLRIEVLKENGVRINMTSFDVHRLSLEDQIFLIKFFESTEEAWMEVECRRLLGIYLRNLQLYDFQLALENRKEKCNLVKPETDIAEGIHQRGFVNRGMESEGYVYKKNVQLVLFRTREVMKYSDATLSWLLSEMKGYLADERDDVKRRCMNAISRRLELRRVVRDCGKWLFSEVNTKKILQNDFVLPSEYEMNLSFDEDKEIIDLSSPNDQKMDEAEAGVSESKEEGVKIDLNDIFLEFDFPGFFIPTEVNFLSVYHDKTPEYQEWVAEKIRCLGKRKEAVYSEFSITGIRELKVKTFRKYEYATFEVLREDGKVYYFTDADFVNLSVDDFYRLYRLLCFKESSRNKSERVARSIVIEAMFYILRWHGYTDLQVALYLNRPGVFLSNPNTELENMSSFKTGSVHRYPEMGVILKIKNEKKFFRISEVAKYCSGTLRLIKSSLEKKLVKIRESSLTEEVKSQQSEIVQTIFNRIENRLNQRNVLLLKFIPALNELSDSKYKDI